MKVSYSRKCVYYFLNWLFRCIVLFVVEQESPDVWLFDGGGFGHGAGLSQAGAIDLASRGWSSERILRHYFPGAELQPVKNLSSQGSP